MIRVTERASEALGEMLRENQVPEGQAVKLFPDPSGSIAMTIAPTAEGDEVVEKEHRPVLIVDAEIVDRLDGALLDFTRGEDDVEPRFEIREPRPPGSGG